MMEENSNKDEILDPLKPFIESYTRKLLKDLVDKNVLTKTSGINPEERYYKLAGSSKKQIPIEENIVRSSSNQSFITEYFEFRNQLKAIYPLITVKHETRIQDMLLTTIMEEITSLGNLKVSLPDIQALKDILDKGGDLLQDEAIRDKAIQLFKEYKIDLSHFRHEVLKYLVKTKLNTHLDSYYPVSDLKIKNIEFDLVFSNPNQSFNLLTSIKFRKQNLIAKDILSDAIFDLQRANGATFKDNFLLVVVFTHEDHQNFEKLKFKFNEFIEEYHYQFVDRIHFVPISIYHPGMLDIEFKSLNFHTKSFRDKVIFKKKHRKDPNLTDDYYEKTIDLKSLQSFEALVTPISTNYWRLGFKFSTNTVFPDLETEGRHVNGYPDVHISVGNPNAENIKYVWMHQNHLEVTEYFVQPIDVNTFPRLTSYKGEPIKILFMPIENSQIYRVSVYVNATIIGYRDYNLSNFSYAKLSAWCDQEDFELKTLLHLQKK